MKFIYLLLPALFLVSCKTEKIENTSSTTPTEVTYDTSAASEFNVKDVTSLVGKKLEVVQQALEAAEIRFRVIEKDGEPLIMTMDYIEDRLNFKIKDGVIIEVSKG